jgi:CxxC motif-containing protein (DUF1111 family)
MTHCLRSPWRIARALGAGAALWSAACTSPDAVRPAAETAATGVDTDARSGGAMTVYDATSRAFDQPGPTLTAAQLANHDAGASAFAATYLPSPDPVTTSGTGDAGYPAPLNPGLGPRFENVGCSQCHAGNGRGTPPAPGESFFSMLFRMSVPGSDAHGGPAPVPGYGTQLELVALSGLTPMARMSVQYADSIDRFADGAPDTLHVPRYTMDAPYLPLPAGVMYSPRAAPPSFGLGLLEAVAAPTIEALATAPASVAAGVAGHPNYVWDPTSSRIVLGRFGVKANTGSLLEQVAAALNADMGITSSVFPNETCDDPVPGCATHPPEASDSLLAVLAAYVRTLAVPARRNSSAADVEHGQTLFASAGCSLCHVPTLQTGTVAADPELSDQRIHPYTDLLLHDMGPGLADGRPDYLATGSEWRTPPLWGIGLTATVNGHTTFLHDGRARSLLEAIMWHGGQGAAARERVRVMSKSDRDALIAFLMSL